MERANELQLDPSDSRGKWYDNGANMQKKRSGVKARIFQMNPIAVHVPRANYKRGCG